MSYVTNDLKEQCFKIFETLFPKELLNQLANSSQRNRIFPPLVTIKGFMYQCLSPEHSCRSAIIFLFDRFNFWGSLKTSAYCRARSKLDTNILKQLAISSGKNICQSLGRVIWVDGSIFQMWDSIENRSKYPHSRRQKKGLGQPVIRALGLFCANTGAFLDLEFGKFKGKGQAETSLLRKMLNRLLKGDILVMDRFFTSPYLLLQISRRDIDFVVRMRKSVSLKLIKKFKVKNGDGIVMLIAGHRSTYKEDAKIGKEIKVRIIKSKIYKKGCRSTNLFIVTTLFTKKKYEVVELYGQRWGIEVAFRNLKSTMGLGFIKAKTPSMVEKEIWVSLMTYNLLVCTISLTKLIHVTIKQISFKTVGQLLFSQHRITLKQFNKVIELLSTTAFESPYRVEPRAIKKRNNKYPLLGVPRKQIKKRIGKGSGQNMAA